MCLIVEKSGKIFDWRKIIPIPDEVFKLLQAIEPLHKHCSNCDMSYVRGCITFYKTIQKTFGMLENDVKEKKISLYYADCLQAPEKLEKIKLMCLVFGNDDILQSISKMEKEYNETNLKMQQLLVVRYKRDNQYHVM